MYRVGLTGNIASGKSTVSRHFLEWGATVLDADAIVRELQAPGTSVFQAIADRFGSGVVGPDGTLDRSALRARVLADERARTDLNGIVHPAVAGRRAELEDEARARGDLIVVNDIPLLFEVLDPTDFDAVVLVDAPASVRRDRLMRDRDLDESQAQAFIDAQMPAGQKRRSSHHVIDNDGSLDLTRNRAWAVWTDLRRAAARTTAVSGPLLFVFSHPDDESYSCGGTIARYRDAGVDVRLICVTDGEAGSHTDAPRAEIRRRRGLDLERAADVLDLTEVVRLGLPDGGLDAADPDPVALLRQAMERIRPEAVITFGPDGVTGHPDHVATARWVRDAVTSFPETRLLEITFSEVALAAFPLPIHRRPPEALTVQLDVRPWMDRKRAAILAHRTQRTVFDLDAPEIRPYLEREWYVEPATPQPFRTVLL